MPMWCVEVAVLDRLQAGDQQLRHLLDADQAAFFLLLAIERGDARRIQARDLELALAGDIANAGDAAAGNQHFDAASRHGAVDVVEAAAGDLPAPAVLDVAARTAAVARVVTRGVQFGLERARVHYQARPQLQRSRVDAGRNLPLQAAETLADLVVEVEHVRDQEPQAQADRGQRPGHQPALPLPGFAAVVLVAVVFVVIDRHGMSK